MYPEKLSKKMLSKNLFTYFTLLCTEKAITFCPLFGNKKAVKGRNYDPEPDPYSQKWRAELGMQKVLLIQPQLSVAYTGRSNT